MQRAAAAVTGLLILPLLAGGASAQNEERFRLERTEEGYVRMDAQTGAMTICRESSGELVCRPASERDAAGGQSEIEALRDRVATLEERIQALEEGTERSVPLEKEFEQSLNMMERFFRRFVDIVRGLEQEEQQQEQTPRDNAAPPANRT